MRKMLIAGNWKMHMTAGETEQFFREFMASLRQPPFQEALGRSRLEVALFPPFTSLYVAAFALEEAPRGFSLGAQTVHWETHGALTGEISPAMVEESGCRYCLVGHSERRHLFGETDEMTNLKVRALLATSLRPVLCVGETLAERERGETFTVVRRQLLKGLESVPAHRLGQDVVVAYEPVWAIGTGKTASDDDAQEVCHFLRSVVGDQLGAEGAESLRVLYGGSVKAENSAGLMARPDIDGALVGGASLKSDSFLAILKESLSALA
ncbi:MAG: triose-phosphate isomerase [Synergistales bacterium]|nr:triose-phosphate isomerase [Synergistales bacterium]